MIYFISDLHLSPATPGAQAIFGRLLDHIAQPGNSLYILGDFFEYWVGDDDLSDPFNQSVAHQLRRAHQQGLEIRLLHGNRDFLLGSDFCAATGCQLLSDPYVLSTPEWQFVLSHGDHLCTADTAYQAFRSQVRKPEWQQAFLSKPLAERRAIAQHMRAESQQQKLDKDYGSMDVSPIETEDFLRQYGYATLIHGHTHRPARHDLIVDGIHVERWVLSDWSETMGEALCWNGAELVRQPLT